MNLGLLVYLVLSGTPSTIAMFDNSGTGVTNSIISQGDGYIEIDSMGTRLNKITVDYIKSGIYYTEIK